MERKTLIANIIFYSLIVFVIVGMIIIIFLLKGNGAECVKNPFVYGAKNSVGLKSNQGGDKNPEVSCSCTVFAESISSRFCFNSTEVNDCSSPYLDSFNFGK